MCSCTTTWLLILVPVHRSALAESTLPVWINRSKAQRLLTSSRLDDKTHSNDINTTRNSQNCQIGHPYLIHNHNHCNFSIIVIGFSCVFVSCHSHLFHNDWKEKNIKQLLIKKTIYFMGYFKINILMNRWHFKLKNMKWHRSSYIIKILCIVMNLGSPKSIWNLKLLIMNHLCFKQAQQ